MKRMLILIRRELWEHPALWAAPVAVSGLILIGAAFGRMNLPSHVELPPHLARAIFGLSVLGFGIAQYVTMSIVLWLYATDCLYAERKDRSILFWKSLPVSDALTVLSKAVVAIVAAPLIVFVITAVTSVLAFGIWSLRGLAGPAPMHIWDTRTWLRVEGDSLLALLVATLWYAPITAYLMLFSAWARRNVQLWVILPPLVALIVERVTFGTHHLTDVLLYRLGGGWESSLVLSIERLFASVPGPYAASSAPPPLFTRSPLHVFANIDLWVGLAVAAGFLFGAVRIRRYRDDS
jgi:ABC-2 type transport system permease protein